MVRVADFANSMRAPGKSAISAWNSASWGTRWTPGPSNRPSGPSCRNAPGQSDKPSRRWRSSTDRAVRQPSQHPAYRRQDHPAVEPKRRLPIRGHDAARGGGRRTPGKIGASPRKRRRPDQPWKRISFQTWRIVTSGMATATMITNAGRTNGITVTA